MIFNLGVIFGGGVLSTGAFLKKKASGKKNVVAQLTRSITGFAQLTRNYKLIKNEMERKPRERRMWSLS